MEALPADLTPNPRLARVRRITFRGFLVVAALAAGTGGGFLAYPRLRPAPTASAGASVGSLVAVTRGTITNSITTTGSVSFASREALTFGVAGTIGEVAVTDGQQVKAGDVIARLDDATLTTLRKQVADDRVAIQKATDALTLARTTASALDVSKKLQAVAQAQLALETAWTALDTLLAPAAEEDVARLQRAVDAAAIEVQKAQRDLDTLAGNQPTQQTTVTEALTAAQLAYREAFMKHLGMTLTDDQLAMEPSKLVSDARIDLDDIFDPNRQDSLRAAMAEERSGAVLPWTPTKVWAQFFLMPPAQRASSTPTAVRTAFDTAWNALVTARKAADNLGLDQAAALATARTKLDTALTNRSKAEDALAATLAEPGTTEVSLKRQQVVTAGLDLARVQQELADLQAAKPDPLVVAQKEAEVAVAQGNLDRDTARVEKAVLQAPFDGYVTGLTATAGGAIGANAVVATVVSTQTAQVVANLDEVDVAQVAAGMPVELTLDAFRGRRFTGKITGVAATGRTQQNVVTYPVTITLDSATGMREGLTATASVILERTADVLVVPSRSVQGGGRVQVLKDGKPESRNVTTGRSDGTNTQVVSGVEFGELIVIPAASKAASTQQAGQTVRPGQIIGGGGFTTGSGPVGGAPAGAGGVRRDR